MEPKKLLSADYLDIIFDNRNKTYGGYELRRSYNGRVKKAAGIVILGVAAVLSFSFIAVRHGDVSVKPYSKADTLTIIDNRPPIQIPKRPDPITPPPPPPHMKSAIFTPPEILEDDQIPDDKQMTQNKDLNNEQPGPVNSVGDSIGLTTGNIEAKGTGTGVVPVANNNNRVPVRWVEQMPQFSGDMDAYINDHLHYPALASEQGITGKVTIEFVVNEDGAVSNVKIMRGIGGGCDEEAIRMVSSMPKWKPGKQNGIPVKVLFILPITFVLN